MATHKSDFSLARYGSYTVPSLPLVVALCHWGKSGQRTSNGDVTKPHVTTFDGGKSGSTLAESLRDKNNGFLLEVWCRDETKKGLRDGSFLRASTQTQRTVLGTLWVSMHVRCCCSFRGVTIDLLLSDCCFFYPDLCSLGGPSPNSKPSTSVVTDSGSSLFKQTKSFSPEHFVCCQMDRKECKIVLKCASKGQRSLVRQCGAPPNGGKNPACSVGSERVQFDFGVREQKRRLLFTWSTSTWPLTHFLSWTSHPSRIVKLDPLTFPGTSSQSLTFDPEFLRGVRCEGWAEGHTHRDTDPS